MTDPSRYRDDKPDTGRRWGKAVVVVFLILVLVTIVMLVAGGGHGPQQHF